MDDEREVRPGWLPPRPPGPPDPSPAARAPAPAPPAGPSPEGPPAQPQPQRPRPDGRAAPLEFAAVAAGAISLLLLLFSLGLFFLYCALLSLGALFGGRAVRRRDAAAGREPSGRARAAIVLAWVGIGLSVLAAVVWLSLDAAGISPNDVQRELEQLEDRLRREARERSR